MSDKKVTEKEIITPNGKGIVRITSEKVEPKKEEPKKTHVYIKRD